MKNCQIPNLQARLRCCCSKGACGSPTRALAAEKDTALIWIEAAQSRIGVRWSAEVVPVISPNRSAVLSAPRRGPVCRKEAFSVTSGGPRGLDPPLTHRFSPYNVSLNQSRR
jgi:hypothetical protein